MRIYLAKIWQLLLYRRRDLESGRISDRLFTSGNAGRYNDVENHNFGLSVTFNF
jgi:hypothetical protein